MSVLNFLHCPSSASLVQCCDKGPANNVVQAVTTFMNFLGLKKICLRTDGEPASGALAHAIKIARNDKTQLETTTRFSSSSLGAVERSNRSVEGQIRCMRIALEKAAVSRTMYSSGSADMLVGSSRDFTCRQTPYHRPKGKPYSGELAEGEQVYVKDAILRHAKLDDRWIGPVTWIGKADRGDRQLTVSRDGHAVELYRSIRRISFSQR